MIMNFPTVEILNQIDLTNILNRVSDEDSFKQYINLSAGTEHYRLLAWFSHQFNNNTIVDIGSFKGFSAAALSNNPLNKIYSFDICDSVVLNPIPENVKFIIDSFQNHMELVRNSPIIFYDTVHDGIHETEFMNWLSYINYTGIVIFDDIYLNNEMIQFWNNIKYKKLDVTSIGHWSGTGIVWL